MNGEMEIEKYLPKVINSEGDIVSYNPDKIIKSLINETHLAEKTAIKVAKTLTRELIRDKVTFLSGPLIRERVCDILIRLGYEEERKLYTRAGMPIADVKKLLDSNPTIQDQIKELISMGFLKNGNVGKIVYETLKEYYALTDPWFMFVWKIHKIIKKFF